MKISLFGGGAIGPFSEVRCTKLPFSKFGVGKCLLCVNFVRDIDIPRIIFQCLNPKFVMMSMTEKRARQKNPFVELIYALIWTFSAIGDWQYITQNLEPIPILWFILTLYYMYKSWSSFSRSLK